MSFRVILTLFGAFGGLRSVFEVFPRYAHNYIIYNLSIRQTGLSTENVIFEMATVV